jgi:Ca-activated chloride channel family protein
MGLATAVNRLKDSKAKSKIVILLTDGVNNAGFIEPETAADIAKQYGIKVYTIGEVMEWLNRLMLLGSSIIFQMMKVEIDEQLMKNIARKQMVNILEQLVMTN